MKVSIREAKAKFSELVSAVQSGERVVVTKHGRSVAEIRAVAGQGGIDFGRLDILRRELGIVNSSQEWPAEFDDPNVSRDVLGLK